MFSEVVERDGLLFVLGPWESDFSEPVQYRLAWPTGVSAQDYSHLIGEKAIYERGGRYRLLPSGIYLELEFGEKTYPSEKYQEKRPIPRPRGYREYRGGKWVR